MHTDPEQVWIELSYSSCLILGWLLTCIHHVFSLLLVIRIHESVCLLACQKVQKLPWWKQGGMKIRKAEIWYLFHNLTPHYLTAESLWAGRQIVGLRRFVTQGLAGLHSVSDTLAQCLLHWQDCQSYLSQLCLVIRLVVPSVASSSPVHNKWQQLNPLLLIKLSTLCTDVCFLFSNFSDIWKQRSTFA